MKKSIFYAIVGFITISLSLVSCNGLQDNSSSNGVAGTITAEGYGFDGANSGKFTSTKAGIVKTSAGGTTIYTISGIRDGGTESISMVLYGDITGPKTIALGNNNPSSSGIIIRKDYQNVTDQTKSYSTDNNSQTMTGGGEVKITSVSGNKIEGTFYAVAYNSSASVAFLEQGKFSGTVN